MQAIWRTLDLELVSELAIDVFCNPALRAAIFSATRRFQEVANLRQMNVRMIN
jgi:hypothetical protein